MSRWIAALAAGALLALGAFLAVTVLAPAGPGGGTDPARAIAQDLRCPDCEGLSVADSSSQAAAQIRREIVAQLAQGRTPDQVRQSFVDRYGEWILLSPRSPILWVLPAALLVVGLGLLIAWLARRSSPGAGPPAAGTDNAARRSRVRDEAEALDA